MKRKYIVWSCVILGTVLVAKPAKEFYLSRTQQPGYLNDAIGKNDYQRIKWYIRFGNNINVANSNHKDYPYYVNASVDNYSVNIDEWFPLGSAVSNRRPQLVKYLVANGANVNFRTRAGNTAMHLACRTWAPLGMVKQLLSYGADINVVGAAGYTPLDFANVEDAALVAYLLDNGAKTGARKLTMEEAEAIECPGSKPNLDVKKIFAADRNQLNSTQKTLDELLNEAVRRGAYETAAMLLGRGANPNAIDRLSRKMPIIACLHNWHYQGSTQEASFTPQYSDSTAKLVALLIKSGANLKSAVDEYGVTPLHLACGRHDAKLAKVLLKAGADPNAKDANGRTPFSYLDAVEEQIR